MSPNLIQKEVFLRKNTGIYSVNEKNFDHAIRVKCS